MAAFTIKGVDEDLLIEFKVCAIRQKKTMLEAVSEALREYVERRKGEA